MRKQEWLGSGAGKKIEKERKGRRDWVFFFFFNPFKNSGYDLASKRAEENKLLPSFFLV